jgi:hypothetical protein
VTAVIGNATCMLLKTRLSDGRLLVEGKTWTGFANLEKRYADEYVNQKIQPFWIEDEARKLDNTTVVVGGRVKPHAVRDRNPDHWQAAVVRSRRREPIVEALA